MEGKPQSPSQQNNSSGAAIFNPNVDLWQRKRRPALNVHYQNEIHFTKNVVNGYKSSATLD